MFISTFLTLLTAARLAFADIKFTAPVAGATIAADLAFAVTWIDEGSRLSLSDISSYSLVLYSGSNPAPVPISTLATLRDPSSKSTTVTIAAGLGGSTPNAYFLGMTTIAKDGGQTINYSDRFTLSQMTGTFTEDIKNSLSSVSGTAGPVDVQVEDAGFVGLEIRQAAVPFNEQSGPTRYAPMQPVPPTSITAQNTSPIFPTSSVVVATTFLPIPTVQTTITAAQTFAVASKANTAAPQPQPSDDMSKFLNRWRD